MQGKPGAGAETDLYKVSGRKKTKGHPVHYMVCVKNRENRRKITALIAEALHEDVKRKIMLIFYRAPWQ